MRKLLPVALLFCITAANAKEPAKSNMVKVLIRPECKSIYYPPDFDGKHHKWPDYEMWNP